MESVASVQTHLPVDVWEINIFVVYAARLPGLS